jgi:PII-like signaling protein
MSAYQPAKLMRVHISEHDRYKGRSLHEVILETCRQMKIAGATVFRGLEGYGETAEIHRRHLLGHDLPIVINIVDSAENIERLAPVIEGMMETGLIVVSDVEIKRIQKRRVGQSV